MQKILFKLVLSCLALLIILGSLELVARIFKPAPIQTKLETAYIPPFPPKDKDSLRIFIYGGSTTQGLPLEKVGFVSQFEDQLHHILGPDRKIEVYNFGWSGYNSTMVRYLVDRTIKQQPDLLIVYTGENEFISNEARNKSAGEVKNNYSR